MLMKKCLILSNKVNFCTKTSFVALLVFDRLLFRLDFLKYSRVVTLAFLLCYLIDWPYFTFDNTTAGIHQAIEFALHAILGIRAFHMLLSLSIPYPSFTSTFGVHLDKHPHKLWSRNVRAHMTPYCLSKLLT